MRKAAHKPSTEDKFVPLDDILQVRVLELREIREAIKGYLSEHDLEDGIDIAAGRGKLIASVLGLAKNEVVFGELVKSVQKGIDRSEYRPIRRLDPRELARTLCTPAA